MALDSKRQALVTFVLKQIENYEPNLIHNKVLFDIYEGNLLEYVLEDLATQLSPESFKTVVTRVAPINVLKRIVDKLSTIYSKPPKRIVVNGTSQDEALLAYYERSMSINATMNIANELFNLHKSTTLEPFIDEKMIPKLRAVPSDRSLFLTTNHIDPTSPTIWVKFMGEMLTYSGEMETVVFIYTEDDFIPVSLKSGEVIEGVLLEQDNMEMVNPLGTLPGIYINKSFHRIVPQMDTDVLRMTKLIPILISDLNFASLFQSFSIMYGIDVSTENLRMSPNAFWNFKSDPTSDKTPKIDVIKPQVDIEQMVQLIQAELTLWLNTKNIRPGTVGGLSSDNFASGISKIIDEMDTAEDRQKQVHYFKKSEQELWDLITKSLHPYWLSQGMIENKLQWSPNVKIEVEFQEQLPLTRRSELLKDIIIELDKGLTTKERAIKILNPEMSNKEIQALIEQVATDKTESVELRDLSKETEDVNIEATQEKQVNQEDGENEAVPV